MVRYSTLALAGLATYTACAAAGTGVFFDKPSWERQNSVAAYDPEVKQRGGNTCNSGAAACDKYCMDPSSTCCNVGSGESCPAGYKCYSYGCCPENETCTERPSGCRAEHKLCGMTCTKSDHQCCPGKVSCPASATCDRELVCRP